MYVAVRFANILWSYQTSPLSSLNLHNFGRISWILTMNFPHHSIHFKSIMILVISITLPFMTGVISSSWANQSEWKRKIQSARGSSHTQDSQKFNSCSSIWPSFITHKSVGEWEVQSSSTNCTKSNSKKRDFVATSFVAHESEWTRCLQETWENE